MKKRITIFSFVLICVMVFIWLYIVTTPAEISCCDDPDMTQEEYQEIMDSYQKEERIRNMKKLFNVR